MNQARIIYHLARADFLERVRRYSFLVMLGAVVFLGYQAAIGNVNMQAGNYRGEYNSAWVGSMMAIIASFFLGWFGFYLVKGSLARDRETGVGQIMATTPLKRPLYTFGKWLSNFAVLLSMVIVLAIAGIAIQIFTGESNQFDFMALLFPFLFIALPMFALVAATAVLFESIGFLQGSVGNIVYFFIFVLMLPLSDFLSKINSGIEPLGFRLDTRKHGCRRKSRVPRIRRRFHLGLNRYSHPGRLPLVRDRVDARHHAQASLFLWHSDGVDLGCIRLFRSLRSLALETRADKKLPYPLRRLNLFPLN